MKLIRFTCLLALALFLPSLHAQDRLVFSGLEGSGKGRSIVLIAGDEEYRTEESCPALAKILSQRHGFECTVLFSQDPKKRFIDPNNQNNIPRLNALDKADLLIIGTRFRQLSPVDYQHLADFLNAGKPVIGFRTATHAFTGSGKTGDFKWSQFGLQILGETWISHHGRHKVEGTRGVIEVPNAKHPVLQGVKDVFGPTDVYGIRNLDPAASTILLRGAVTASLDPSSEPIDGPKNNPMMPLAWLREYTGPNGTAKGQAFCTTMGASVDFLCEDLRRLVVNAAYHLLKIPVPPKADVRFVDDFEPTFYGFIPNPGQGRNAPPSGEKSYFEKRNLRVADFQLGRSASTGLPENIKVPESYRPVGSGKAAPVEKRKDEASKTAPVGLTEAPQYRQPAKASAKPQPVRLPLKPAQGERVVLLGNQLGEGMQYGGYFEMELQRRFPEHQLVVRNMCNGGDTPGFRAHSSRTNQWAFPGAEQFHPDKQAHFGIGHFPSPDEWLTELEADTIIAFFGYNESFDGIQGLENFKAELTAFIRHSQSLAYNGETAPRMVLVTPIAFEDRRNQYDLPDGIEENKRLAVYAQAVQEVAAATGIASVNAFTITQKWFSEPSSAYTLNGCHLSQHGYARFSPWLVDQLFGPAPQGQLIELGQLRSAVQDKDWFWFNDYRMLNGVHVYGRRWKPYGNVNYPEEIEKIRQMTELRDERIWELASGKTGLPPVSDNLTRSLSDIDTNFRKPIEYLGREKAMEKFTIMDGFQVELFASESEFPDLRNPVQMSFDNKGRLWVAVLPSYPHYKPGDERPNDKILIFEDTDGDGRADRQKVFADRLHLPIGFEIAPEGVYVSQEPHLCLLIDDDGDDRADRMERLLTGFDSHDTHHAISAYCADPSGAFYLCEGRFLHSQVETPYGPQRMTDGGVWRFQPFNWRLERYSQADYSNPWGITFDYWEQCYISDASPGENWWGLPVSAKMPHGLEVPKVDQFAPKRSRPTSGTEFVSSRHFPDELQGHFMINNSIGFLGTSFHDVWEDGSGFYGKHVGDLLASTDPNYRPVDLEFAPDGSLYIVDWHNALIGHMQHNARDPNRDHDHGRIYRVTYPSRPLVKPAQVAGASVETLLENLKLPEYRTRYRTRRELRGHGAKVVLPALKKWVAGLDRKDPEYEHHLAEALWVTWGLNRVDQGLLRRLLQARAHQARAAAVHVLRYVHPKIQDSTSLFLQAAHDPHGRVRLESIVAASWLDNQDGARIVLEALRYPFDRWMGPVTEAILKTTLAEEVKALIAGKGYDLATNPRAEQFLAGKLKLSEPVVSDKDKAYGPTRKLSEADTKVYLTGKEIFWRDGHCATCHQGNGQGVPGIYPPLVAKDNPWLSEHEERLIKVALKGLWGPMELKGQKFDPSKGVPPMPGFGPLLTDEELAAVLSYVRTSFGNDLPFIRPDQVAKVRAQVSGRQDYYLIPEIMKEHPIPGWEKWDQGTTVVKPSQFE